MGEENGSEKLQAKIGDKAISLAVRDLLPMVMLALVALAGYLFWQDARRYQAQVAQSHLTMYRALQEKEAVTIRALEVLQYNLGQPHGERLPLTVASDELRKQEGPR